MYFCRKIYLNILKAVLHDCENFPDVKFNYRKDVHEILISLLYSIAEHDSIHIFLRNKKRKQRFTQFRCLNMKYVQKQLFPLR
jgi:hypothetical protein